SEAWEYPPFENRVRLVMVDPIPHRRDLLAEVLDLLARLLNPFAGGMRRLLRLLSGFLRLLRGRVRCGLCVVGRGVDPGLDLVFHVRHRISPINRTGCEDFLDDGYACSVPNRGSHGRLGSVHGKLAGSASARRPRPARTSRAGLRDEETNCR